MHRRGRRSYRLWRLRRTPHREGGARSGSQQTCHRRLVFLSHCGAKLTGRPSRAARQYRRKGTGARGPARGLVAKNLMPGRVGRGGSRPAERSGAHGPARRVRRSDPRPWPQREDPSVDGEPPFTIAVCRRSNEN
jgi:hypothetical protein